MSAMTDNYTMKKSGFLLAAICIILCFTLLSSDRAFAKIFKWTDENGQTHYSDHPPQAAQPTKNIKEIPTDDIRPQSSVHYGDDDQDAGGGPYDKGKKSEESRERKTHQVELYVTSWCPYCKQARAFFQARGIPFKEYDIEKDAEAARRKNNLDPRRGIPFAVINGHRIHGYVPSAYEMALQDPSQ